MLSNYNVTTKSIPGMKKISISGKSLAHYRDKAGYTQGELAEELGINRVTLTGWEGKESVTLTEKQASILTSLLKVTTIDLTNVPHETRNDGEMLKVYKELATERMYRIEELKQQVQSLRDELAECRSPVKKK